jgi:hypothetical protein
LRVLTRARTTAQLSPELNTALASASLLDLEEFRAGFSSYFVGNCLIFHLIFRITLLIMQ